MANYRALLRTFPAIADYFRNARWIRRGDVMAYPPNVEAKHFTTDGAGFRHTVFGGNAVGLAEASGIGDFGLLLGSSHTFGFGLSSNAETLASRLSEATGLRYLNICYPEADSRTLFASLARVLRNARGRVKHVVFISGGDFTRWCFHVRADPLFGTPILPLPGAEPAADMQEQFTNLLHFNFFWTRLAAQAVSAAGAGFLLGDDITFFEKSSPDEIERIGELGAVAGEGQSIRFESHRRFALTFQAERRKFAAVEKIAIAAFPDADRLLYIDEYHYRAETLADISDKMAGKIYALPMRAEA